MQKSGGIKMRLSFDDSEFTLLKETAEFKIGFGGGMLNISLPETKSFKIIFDDLEMSGTP